MRNPHSESPSFLALWFAELRRGPLVRQNGYFDRLERSIAASAPGGASHAC